jgi:hypothetical protein
MKKYYISILMLSSVSAKAFVSDTSQFDNRFYLYKNNYAIVNSSTNNVLDKSENIISGSNGTKLIIHTKTYISGDTIINEAYSFDIYDSIKNTTYFVMPNTPKDFANVFTYFYNEIINLDNLQNRKIIKYNIFSRIKQLFTKKTNTINDKIAKI